MALSVACSGGQPESEIPSTVQTPLTAEAPAVTSQVPESTQPTTSKAGITTPTATPAPAGESTATSDQLEIAIGALQEEYIANEAAAEYCGQFSRHLTAHPGSLLAPLSGARGKVVPHHGEYEGLN